MLTTTAVAKQFGVQGHVIRRIVDELEQVPRVGLWRLIPERLIPKIRTALVRKGYLEAEPDDPR